MDVSALKDGKVEVEVDGERIALSERYFDVVRIKEKVNGIKVVPHVIEPSHGLDRILYTCLEHAYTSNDEYTRLGLSIEAAPIKVGVFPLMARDDLDKRAMELDRKLREQRIVTYYDDSGSIGRRYARMDEVGTPWCITVDYEVFENGTVTIRERDSSRQVRIPYDRVVETLGSLLRGASLESIT
jgi:glycyl-tRNA synthetase